MKPTVFISSTIYDFEDLRNATKYWLEQAGYKVFLSDNPGFIKEIEQNSYDACFDAIRRSQIFIVFVGGRRGGWFDEGERISITQQEYRVAREEFQKGNIRILPFIRRSIWDLNAQYSELIEEADEQAKHHLNVKNRLVDDPAHLKYFIDEIRRLEEMKIAAQGLAPRPGGNWVHIFSDFREVIESLQVALPLEVDISTKALLNSVVREVTAFLKQFMIKRNGKIGYAPDMVQDLIYQLPFSKKDYLENPTQLIELDIKHVRSLVDLALCVIRSLPLIALEKASYLDSLTDFNPTNNKVESNELQISIQRTYRTFREISERAFVEHYAELRQKILTEASGCNGYNTWHIPAMTITHLVGSANNFRRAIAEGENLLNFLINDQKLHPNPTLEMPVSPFMDEDERIADETITDEEALFLIKSRELRHGAS